MMARRPHCPTSRPTTTTGPEPGGVNLYCAGAPCATGEVCCYYQFAKGQDFCEDSQALGNGHGYCAQ